MTCHITFAKTRDNEPTEIVKNSLQAELLSEAMGGRLLDSYGNTVSCSTLEGRVVMLFFGAKWAKPCEAFRSASFKSKTEAFSIELKFKK